MTYGRVADAFVWTPVSMPGKRRRSKRHTVQGRREREFKNRWGLCSCRATQAGEHCAMSKGMLPRTSPFKAADGDLGPFSSGRRCLGAWLRPEVAQVGDPAHLGDCQRRASEDRAESRASRFYYVMRVCMVMGPRWASGRRGTGVGTRSESQRPSSNSVHRVLPSRLHQRHHPLLRLRMNTLFRRLAPRHVASPHTGISPSCFPWSVSSHFLLPRRTCLAARNTTSLLPPSSPMRTSRLYSRQFRPWHQTLRPHNAGTRTFTTWIRRFSPRRRLDPLDEPSDCHEEAAKAAVLEKAMKGRQPTDLMLRCEPALSQVLRRER